MLSHESRRLRVWLIFDVGQKEMSNAASHAATFYREVAATKKVWAIRDSGGFPAPMTPEGKRSMPFWSSLSRAKKIISGVPAYAKFEAHELSWEAFRDAWLPGLKKDGCLAGVNWSGEKAKGYDVEPDIVREAIEFQIRALAP